MLIWPWLMAMTSGLERISSVSLEILLTSQPMIRGACKSIHKHRKWNHTFIQESQLNSTKTRDQRSRFSEMVCTNQPWQSPKGWCARRTRRSSSLHCRPPACQDLQCREQIRDRQTDRYIADQRRRRRWGGQLYRSSRRAWRSWRRRRCCRCYSACCSNDHRQEHEHERGSA